MKCLNCHKENEGRSKYCDNTCKTKFFRSHQTVSEQTVSSGDNETVSPIKQAVKPPVRAYVTIIDQKVYSRQAVRYSNIVERWDTRPMPLNPDDVPVLNNRGRYKRADGSTYQFDGGGQVFGAVHKYKDNEGKPHLAIYKDADEVRECYV